MDEIARDPNLRYQLHWREFEQLEAEILHRQGWKVLLGPGRKDGGRDIIAEIETNYRFVMAVQCKKHSRKNTIEPGEVQKLFGVILSDNFNKGLLVTTSTFQPAAIEFARMHKTMLDIDNGEDFVRNLRDSLRK
jgi:restriction endonuclease Mrr